MVELTYNKESALVNILDLPDIYESRSDCAYSSTQSCLFDLILYVPVNNLSVTSGHVFLG